MDIVIALLLIACRLYIVYWMYHGLKEIRRAGMNNRWSVAYIISIITYLTTAGFSSFSNDVQNPLRLIGAVASGIIITAIIIALRKKNGE